MEITKYEGRFIKVTEEIMDGAVWERAYIQSGVQVFPITSEGKIYLIEEKRPHEKSPVRLKFVTGLMDKEDEDPLDTANREMQEEIGLKASHLEVLMHRESSGTLNNHFYQIIATNLVLSKIPNPDGEDTIVSVKAYTIAEILIFFETGKMQWNIDALGIFRIQKMLESGKLTY